MQTTITQQAEALRKAWEFLRGGQDIYKPTPEEIQGLQDALDTLTAMKMSNFQEIKDVLQKYHGPIDRDGQVKYLSVIDLLDKLIETFKG
jgi:hypothetical protein